MGPINRNQTLALAKLRQLDRESGRRNKRRSTANGTVVIKRGDAPRATAYDRS